MPTSGGYWLPGLCGAHLGGMQSPLSSVAEHGLVAMGLALSLASPASHHYQGTVLASVPFALALVLAFPVTTLPFLATPARASGLATLDGYPCGAISPSTVLYSLPPLARGVTSKVSAGNLFAASLTRGVRWLCVLLKGDWHVTSVF